MWCVGEWDGKIKPIEFDPKDNCLVCWSVINHKDFETKEEAEEWIKSSIDFGGNQRFTAQELYELNKQKDERIRQLEDYIRGINDTNTRYLNSLEWIGPEHSEAKEY